MYLKNPQHTIPPCLIPGQSQYERSEEEQLQRLWVIEQLNKDRQKSVGQIREKTWSTSEHNPAALSFSLLSFWADHLEGV